MNAELFNGNVLAINNRPVGILEAIDDKGRIQNPTGHWNQVAARLRTYAAGKNELSGHEFKFDLPVYVSETPSSHMLNPELIKSIENVL